MLKMRLACWTQVELAPSDSQRGRRRGKGITGTRCVSDLERYAYLRAECMFTQQAKLESWIPLRPSFLDELLRMDGFGYYKPNPVLACSDCEVESTANELPFLFRCKPSGCWDGCMLRCASCITKRHLHLPLHEIEVSISIHRTPAHG